jgi:hypothetical protein
VLCRFQHQASSVAHPQTNGQVKRANMLILQVVKMRMFHDLEEKEGIGTRISPQYYGHCAPTSIEL